MTAPPFDPEDTHARTASTAFLRRAIPVLAVALLVSLSGCGVIFASGSGGGTQSPGSPDATPSSTPTALDGSGDADGNSTAGQQVSAPSQSLLPASEIVGTHRSRLRAAGNVTRHSLTRTETGGETRTRNGTTRLDFTSDPATQFVSQQFTDQYVEMYLSPSENLTRLGEDDPRYAAGRYNDPFFYGVADSNFRSFNFTGPKRVTVDGETRFRYYANSTDALTEFGRERLRENDVMLKNVSLMVEFTAEGVIRQERYSFVTEEAREVSRTRYTNIGSTTVSEPAWGPEARQAVNESEKDSFTAVQQIDSIPATLLVTGQSENVNPDEGAATALNETSAVYAYNDGINQSRVSKAVNATLPAEYEQATLSLGYDAETVPKGDEENVTLMRYNASANGYVVVTGAFANSSRDTIAGPISESGTYIAVHFPTFAEQQSDGDSTTNDLAPPRARAAP